jgi:hypothetical protein
MKMVFFPISTPGITAKERLCTQGSRICKGSVFEFVFPFNVEH